VISNSTAWRDWHHYLYSSMQNAGQVTVAWIICALVKWHWEVLEGNQCVLDVNYLCHVTRFLTCRRLKTRRGNWILWTYLILCNMWSFHGGDYEECRLLGYKTPVRTSQETHYISATESSQLMLCNVLRFSRRWLWRMSSSGI
jgi:hypothetical protein